MDSERSKMRAPFTLLILAATAAADDFRVRFDIDVPEGPGSFTVLVHDDWAPIGGVPLPQYL